MKNETNIDGIIVAGQPTDDELRQLQTRGVVTCINVRMPEELDEPEAPKVAAGIAYHEVPFTGPTLRADHVVRVRDAVAASSGTVLIHCAAGTRAAVVAGIIAAERAGEGAAGAVKRAAAAGFEVEGTPYAVSIERYFSP